MLFPAVAAAQSDEPRFEAGVLFTGSVLREIGSRDAGPGTSVAGIGGRIIYKVGPWLHLDSDVIVLPGNDATQGNRLQGLFGVKSGIRFWKMGLFAKARPGFIHFRRDPFGVARPDNNPLFTRSRASSTEASMDIGGVLQFYFDRGLILRLDGGDTIINYEPREVFVSQFQPPLQAGGFTTHNLQISFGLGLGF